MARVVVIGGGLGGISAAARLARLGHDVTLVERLLDIGGALRYVEEAGYRWDPETSATTLPAVLRDLFRKSGRPLERGLGLATLDLAPLDVVREHRFDDGTSVVLPASGRGAQLEAVDRGLGPGLGQEWLDWTQRFADVWAALRRDLFERAYSPAHAAKETRDLLRS